MLRKMLRIKKGIWGESMAELLIRANRTLKSKLSDIEAKYEP